VPRPLPLHARPHPPHLPSLCNARAQASFEAIKAKFDGKIKRAPARPALSAERIDQRIAELEYERSHGKGTGSLQVEKGILRDIAKLKVEKLGIAEHAAFEQEITDLKASRGATLDRIKTLSQTIRELREGVRKLEVMERVRVLNPTVAFSPTDIRVGEMRVPREHLPALIGKKGASLRELETATGVVLDVESKDREAGEEGAPPPPPDVVVRITGLEGGIAKAQAAIETIMSQVEEAIKVSDGVQQLLLARTGAVMKQLEADYGERRIWRARGTYQAAAVSAAAACRLGAASS
jgi:hypothetical protein